LQDFDAAARLIPKDPRLYLGRAEVFIQKKDYEKAIEACSEAIRIDPKNFEAYSKRCDLYLKKGDLRKAMEDLSKSSELLPRHWGPGDFPPFPPELEPLFK